MTVLFSITTFLSSFLLFFIQLLAGKRILPWFGGGASVWTGSMLFFTLTLFLGYLYVNWLTKFTPKKQVKIHLSIITLSFICIILNYSWHKSLIFYNPIFHEFSPILQIPAIILFSVGLPFFLLSSTSTLLQYWFTGIEPRRSPYFLYVISNVGSLLGLLSYPFLIESRFPIPAQEIIWLLLFCFYSFLIIKVSSKAKISKSKTFLAEKTTEKILVSQFAPWLGLSTISNMALLSFTGNLTQSISPVPLLWIAPLAIFLITYIISFSGSKWYSRDFHGTIMIFSIIVTSSLATGKITTSYWIQLGATLFTLFIINLVCHAELYLSKPNPNRLVPFYIAISFGGVLASIICALIAPLFFHNLYEFPLSLILTTLALTFILFSGSVHFILKFQHAIVSFLAISVIFIQFNGFLLQSSTVQGGTRISQRNFYGVTTVSQEIISGIKKTILYNGTIVHGTQELFPGKEYEPTTYYTRDSGVGLILDKNAKRSSKTTLRIGIIGLGAGTLSAYCLPGDYFRFYEINPLVINISSRDFSYTSHCRTIGGAVDIVSGDARLSLEKEKNRGLLQKFDVLIIDAFTDDSIPVHLITKEAIQLYLAHLTENGVIAFHISNHYLNLSEVLDQEAYSQNLYSYQYQTQGSQWYLISPKYLKSPFEFYRIIPEKKLGLWTDDYSNIFQIIK